MRPEKIRTARLALSLLLLVLLAACTADVVDLSGDETQTPTPVPVGTATSAKANVRFKRDQRLANDYAAALGLSTAEVCTELGTYSCTEDVHAVGLGGTAAYSQGIFEPATLTGVTAPLIVERLALYGCSVRAQRDLSDPGNAVIFGGTRSSSVTALYRRALQRDPLPSEQAHLEALHADVAAAGALDPELSWATLSCFAVLTSTESLFY